MTVAAEWRGRVGTVWAQEHARTERAFAGIAAALDAEIARHAPDRGRAVDIGCGVGSTTLALAAARPALHVTGVDLSDDLIAVARGRTGQEGPDFVAGDVAAVLPTLAPLDLSVSRHGVMFFADPVAGFADLRHSLTVDGALVFSCFRGRGDNEWVGAAEGALGIAARAPTGYAPGPFSFGKRGFVEQVLAGAGWRDVTVTAHDVPYVVGAGADPAADAVDFYRRIGPAAATLAAADPDMRARHEARLHEMFAARIRDGLVTFSAAIWIVSARAGKEHA